MKILSNPTLVVPEKIEQTSFHEETKFVQCVLQVNGMLPHSNEAEVGRACIKIRSSWVQKDICVKSLPFLVSEGFPHVPRCTRGKQPDDEFNEYSSPIQINKPCQEDHVREAGEIQSSKQRQDFRSIMSRKPRHHWTKNQFTHP